MTDYSFLIDKYSQQYGLPQGLLSRLVGAESAYNPNAVSPVGARGLTQIMPATGANPGYGVAPLRDTSDEENVRFGAEYLSTMLDKFNGSVPHALAAYNSGPGTVDNWDGNLNTLYPETENYVRKIMGDEYSLASTDTTPSIQSMPKSDKFSIDPTKGSHGLREFAKTSGANADMFGMGAAQLYQKGEERLGLNYGLSYGLLTPEQAAALGLASDPMDIYGIEQQDEQSFNDPVGYNQPAPTMSTQGQSPVEGNKNPSLLWQALQAAGIGLGQMSSGQPVNVNAPFAARQQQENMQAEQAQQDAMFAAQQARMAEETAYSRGRDTIGDERWAVEQAQQNEQFALQEERLAGNVDYERNRDLIGDEQWAAEQARLASGSGGTPMTPEQVDASLAVAREAGASDTQMADFVLNPDNLTTFLNDRVYKLTDQDVRHGGATPDTRAGLVESLIAGGTPMVDALAQTSTPEGIIDTQKALASRAKEPGAATTFQSPQEAYDAINALHAETEKVPLPDDVKDRVDALLGRAETLAATNLPASLTAYNQANDLMNKNAGLKTESASAVETEQGRTNIASTQEAAKIEANKAASKALVNAAYAKSPYKEELMALAETGVEPQKIADLALARSEQDQATDAMRLNEYYVNNPEARAVKEEMDKNASDAVDPASQAYWSAETARIDKLALANADAQDKIRQSDQLMQFLSNNPEMNTGSMASWKTAAQKFMRDNLGYEGSDDLTAREIMMKMTTEMATQLRLAGSGSMSDMELTAYMNSVANVESSELANMMMSQLRNNLLKAGQAAYTAELEWLSQSGGKMDPQGRQDAIDAATGEFREPIKTYSPSEGSDFKTDLASQPSNTLVKINAGDGVFYYRRSDSGDVTIFDASGAVVNSEEQ